MGTLPRPRTVAALALALLGAEEAHAGREVGGDPLERRAVPEREARGARGRQRRGQRAALPGRVDRVHPAHVRVAVGLAGPRDQVGQRR
jgi:hypothetical protein